MKANPNKVKECTIRANRKKRNTSEERNKANKCSKIWNQNNKERRYKNQKKWAKNNPNKLKDYYTKKYKKNCKNLKFKININISTGIRRSLKSTKNGYHWETLVGYTLNDLMKHLESLFNNGMSWDNYGRNGWHIDHIKPISNFNFNSYENKKFLECWSLTNLQPLWEKENLRKGSKLIYD